MLYEERPSKKDLREAYWLVGLGTPTTELAEEEASDLLERCEKLISKIPGLPPHDYLIADLENRRDGLKSVLNHYQQVLEREAYREDK